MTNELDDIADRYYADPPDDEWLEDRVVRWIMPKIAGWCGPPGSRVLEMGYGAGRTSEMLINNAVRLDIVEGSRKLVDQAFADLYTGWGGEIICSRFEDFAPGPVYDTVLCLHVLEHVEDPVGLLRRVRGWLKPGGRLIAITPNAYSWHRLLGQTMTGDHVKTLSDRDRLVGHVRVYSIGDLVSDVMAAGFNLDFGGDMPARFSWFHKSLPNSMLLGCSPEVIDGLCELGWNTAVDRGANVGCIAVAR